MTRYRAEHSYDRPSEERLRDGHGHLQYECLAFYRLGGLLVRMYSTSGTPAGIARDAWETLRLAALESWLSHVRCLLMAFRENRAPKFPNDLLFRDYLAPSAWSEVRGSLVPDDESEKRISALGTLVAHLTYSRVDRTHQGEWHVEEYARLDARIRTWYAALGSDCKNLFAPLGDALAQARAVPPAEE